MAKLHSPTRLWHNGQCTSDISLAGVDEVDSLIADALLGNASFMQRGRAGDTLSCIRDALRPIRGDAEGPGIGVGVPSLSVNERDTELARESAGVGGIDTEATNDPERDADMDDVRRRSSRDEGAGCQPKRATMKAVSDNSDDGSGAGSSTCMAEGSPGGGV